MSAPTPDDTTSDAPPSLWRWGLKVAASAGLAGMICCVAPAVLFAAGLMGGIYAISFADFFYAPDGSAGLGAWILRGVAVLVGLGGIWLYRRRQDQCAIDPARKRKNLALVVLLVATLGTGAYLTFEEVTSWYFNEYIVPAQQAEYEAMSDG
jgi:hypothetical protein